MTLAGKTVMSLLGCKRNPLHDVTDVSGNSTRSFGSQQNIWEVFPIAYATQHG